MMSDCHMLRMNVRPGILFLNLQLLLLSFFLELDDQIMLWLVIRDRHYFLYMSPHIQKIYPEK